MRLKDPFLISVVAGTFWFCAGLAVDSPVGRWHWILYLSPLYALIGGVLVGGLAERAQRNEARQEHDWINFECANCGDVHNPKHICYCGCFEWRKGEKILQ